VIHRLLLWLGFWDGAGGDRTGRTRPGGWFRRPRRAWDRTFPRADSFARAFARPAARLDRVWRYSDVANDMPVRVLTKTESDDRVYAFDLSACPELAEAGTTIASAVILGGTGLTVGAPAVTAAAFDGIPAGKAVSVRISGGADGDAVGIACKATLSTGRVVVVPGRMVVTEDYPGA
jgi:hypothetical protein